MSSDIIVVGGGRMGLSIGRLFAGAGWNVQIVEPDDAVRATAVEACSALRFHRALEETDPADIAIECVPEDASLKRRALREMETRVSDQSAILSNTSGLTLAEISADMQRPERAMIAHFFNPADIVPAVEVVSAPGADAALCGDVMQTLRHIGKRPVHLARDVPGFIANRIQHAIMRECLHLVDSGIADPEGIDEIVRWSIGVRLALTGPFRQRDLNGLGTHLAIARYLYPDLSATDTPSPTLERLVAEGRGGRRDGAGFYDWPDTMDDGSDATALRRLIALAVDVDREMPS